MAAEADGQLLLKTLECNLCSNVDHNSINILTTRKEHVNRMVKRYFVDAVLRNELCKVAELRLKKKRLMTPDKTNTPKRKRITVAEELLSSVEKLRTSNISGGMMNENTRSDSHHVQQDHAYAGNYINC
ncbi:hypothetical protein ACF0H5_010823 [Mactra antiquata]